MASPVAMTARSSISLILSSGSAAGASDAQLVQLLVSGRDGGKELVFRALLDRHGSLVWGTCRQLLRHHHDADDAFQATFLVLLRKAASLQVTGSLGPWLYQVAWRVAQRIRSTAAKERTCLSDQLDQTVSPAPDSVVSEEKLAGLHYEVNRLPERYRLPIILCDMEGKTREEAARALRWPVGTVNGRLSRGRSLLRSRLERRGWTTPEDLVGIVVLACPRLPVPLPLLDDCIRAASGLASLSSTGSPVHLIARGVSRTMIWTQWKAAAVAFLLLGAVAGTTGMLMRGLLTAAWAGQADKDRTISPQSLELAALGPQAGAEARPGPAVRKRASQSGDDITLETAPPVVVRTAPQAGDTDVDPNLREIRVIFSKEMMDKSWSWSTASRNSFPEVTGEIHYDSDRRTCVLPVKLEPGRTYATWINSGRFTNFKDPDRRPAVPYLLVFQTRGSHVRQSWP
jgi:RNA polymerase sigma-70 factor (ECF subfamily)